MVSCHLFSATLYHSKSPLGCQRYAAFLSCIVTPIEKAVLCTAFVISY
ncbi:hypothetical protein ACFPFV_13070 [Salinicoccus siamensis]